MNTHVVTKTLPGPQGPIDPGTEVDASQWRNTRLLESQRYIKPLLPKRGGRPKKTKEQ